jgi:type II secretion system protein N
MPVKLQKWQRNALYGAFAFFAFLFALRQTAPIEAVKERLVMEAAAQGWTLTVADIRPAGLAGVGMTGVSLESREGLRIPLERLDATVRVSSLLLGRRGLAFDARLFEGRVRGFVEEKGASRRLAAAIAGVDLSRAVPLRKAIGVDVAGIVGGDLDVVLDEKDPARSAGHVDLVVRDAAVNGGSAPVPGMGGALTLPKMAIGEITAHGAVKEGRLTFDKLEAKGDDLEAAGDGLYVMMQPRMAFAPVFGKARLKLRDAFWTKPGASGFKPIVEAALAPARARDGAYGFQIFGTISAPQARMAPQ